MIPPPAPCKGIFIRPATGGKPMPEPRPTPRSLHYIAPPAQPAATQHDRLYHHWTYREHFAEANQASRYTRELTLPRKVQVVLPTTSQLQGKASRLKKTPDLYKSTLVLGSWPAYLFFCSTASLYKCQSVRCFFPNRFELRPASIRLQKCKSLLLLLLKFLKMGFVFVYCVLKGFQCDRVCQCFFIVVLQGFQSDSFCTCLNLMLARLECVFYILTQHYAASSEAKASFAPLPQATNRTQTCTGPCLNAWGGRAVCKFQRNYLAGQVSTRMNPLHEITWGSAGSCPHCSLQDELIQTIRVCCVTTCKTYDSLWQLSLACNR